MLLKQRMRTAIVGGGIRGMTLAMSLLDAAIEDVDIYESATALKELDVSINITVLPQCSARADGAGSPRRAVRCRDPHRRARLLFFPARPPMSVDCRPTLVVQGWTLNILA
jgi:cation diffusion facilitator CzcD-associated flavoprotein CzcO